MPKGTGPRTSERAGATSLDAYRRKRRADSTPEPFGGELSERTGPRVGEQGLFVVQMHAARRTHYDLRLELDGALKSWAVPQGPSLDPEVKRLAVLTEDHPLEYSDFEGLIPEGNYGAGAMIVWDRGTWIPVEDPVSGMEKGKLLFELRGYKLRGLWTLFRTKPPAIHRGSTKDDGRQWLLMKKPDGAARTGEAGTLPEASILSGLTVEQLAHREEALQSIRAELAELGAPRRFPDPRRLKLMLAESIERPFSRPGWLFELKVDGYRLIAAKQAGTPYLRYRNGHDATALYPELTRVLRALPTGDLILDGEVAILDANGRPSFPRLQKRALLSRALDIQHAALRTPATLFAFDLLAFEDWDLRPLPLRQRKDLLRRLLPPVGPIRYSDHVEERGEAFYQQVERMGLEGMVAKDADSPYLGRRSPHWRKLRLEQTGDFVVVGMSEPKGERQGFGALHLAVCAPDGEREPTPPLVYAGRVGTGFDAVQLAEIAQRLGPLERATPPCSGTEVLPKSSPNLWLEPRWVAEVRYKEWTPQGMLRHPVFLRLRDDKTLAECLGPGASTTVLEDAEGPTPPAPKRSAHENGIATTPAARARRSTRLELTNLDKVFWPEDGYTKGDLVSYYRAVAPYILPYLADRPLVLTRFPDGILGKSFFQKNAPDFAPEWVRTETIWSEGSERDIDYFICNDEETLLYLANLATIPLHIWSSRLASLDRPDWCVLDLDPKEAPFEWVIAIAQRIHELCEEIELPSYIKTSGSSGLHVLLPLGGQLDYEQSRTLGLLIAQIVSRERSDIATIARTLSQRRGKVYIDTLQNGHGRLIVAPLCLRPLPKAPVSAPLRWSEVKEGLDLAHFNLKSMPRRLRSLRSDPLRGVLEDEPDLLAVLGRLSAHA
jgi:bifunctional non-homologous end joining protein LigD